jgi:hypothetical protein
MNITKLLREKLAHYIVKHETTRHSPPRSTSKHANAKAKPRGWHQAKRRQRKAQKLARRAHRSR